MNVYTKKGDKGETSLYGGTRVSKDGLRVWSYGTVDEATSILGVIHASIQFKDLKEIVRVIQRKMFIVGAHLASDEKGRDKLPEKIEEADIQWLEGIIDAYTKDFGKVGNFSIPGETPVSSLIHVARTVVRRAERHVVELARADYVDPMVMGYLNRLSDALFVLAKMEVFQSFVRKVAEEVLAIAENGGKPGAESCLTVALVNRMCAAAMEESEKLGVPVCFSVVDASGVLQYFRRFDGAILASVAISQNKAYTAAALNIPTGALANMSQPGDSLYGINECDQKIVIFGGGFPLHVNGKLVGAIGVSGGSVEEDEKIGNKVLDVFKSYVLDHC